MSKNRLSIKTSGHSQELFVSDWTPSQKVFTKILSLNSSFQKAVFPPKTSKNPYALFWMSMCAQGASDTSCNPDLFDKLPPELRENISTHQHTVEVIVCETACLGDKE
jgi:hypothetical protein